MEDTTAIMDVHKIFSFEVDVTPTHPTVDYLVEDWKTRNYCNPPYSIIWPFFRKVLLETSQRESFVVMLLPDWKDQYSIRLAKNHLQYYRFPYKLTFRGYQRPAEFNSLLIFVETRSAKIILAKYPKFICIFFSVLNS